VTRQEPHRSTVREDLRLSAEERVRLAESLWAEAQRLSPDLPRHFVASFDSFEAYERWRGRRDKPWLY
jgi:hypothetical protein